MPLLSSWDFISDGFIADCRVDARQEPSGNGVQPIPMHTDRGRRKVVEKFTARQGVWILTISVLVCLAIWCLYWLGLPHID